MLGRRRTLVIALMIYTVASVLYLVVDELWLLIALRVLHGMGFGAGAQAVTTAAMDMIPRVRRAEGTGYFSLSTTVSTAAGPSVAVLVTQYASFEVLFVVCTVTSAFGLLLAFALRLPERSATAEEHAARWRMRFTDFFEPLVLRFAAIMFVIGAGWAGFGTYLNSYAREADFVPVASLFFIVYGIFTVVARLTMGRIQDRFGDNAAMYPAIALYAAGLAALALPPSSVTVMLSAILLGFGFGSLLPGLQAIAVTITSPGRIALALSTFFLMLDLGVGLAPLLLGLILPTIGYQGMYATLALLMLACVAVYWWVHGRGRAVEVPA